MATTDPKDKLIADLKANRTATEKNAKEATRLLKQRDRLFERARAGTPKLLTVRELARWSGLAEVSVNKRLKQLRDAAEEAAAALAAEG